MTPQVKQRIEQIKAGQVPDGYKKTKVGIVPSEWLYEKLEIFLIQHREISDYSNQYPVLTSSRKGIFLQSEYYNKEVASEDNTGYNVVPRGYFTYRHMSDDEIFKFNINNIVDKGIVSTLYPVFTTKGINDYFLQTVLNEGREFRRFAILQKQGGSRTYMYFDKLKQLKVCLPPLAEQEKITKILSAQDKVIELKEKLLEEKKEQKKHLMQQLLTGKKRLPGFREEWNELPLSFFLDIRDEKQTPESKVPLMAFVAEKGIVEKGERYDRSFLVKDENKQYKRTELNDFIYSSNNLDVGSIGLNQYGTAVISVVYEIFKVKETAIPIVLSEIIQMPTNMNKILRFRQGALYGQYKIHPSEFLKVKVKIPNIAEQIALAEVMGLMDDEITLITKELEQEKQKKKALMQLLLTGIVRV